MSSKYSPHILNTENSEEEKIRQHLDSIALCRQSPCPVPDKHWFYPTPNRPPFYYGKRPCLPVVPTRLALGKVMILGAYPTCRFATIDSEKFVPVKDIDEPFEDSRYFDNNNVRDVRSGDVLYEIYLGPLGLDDEEDLWITNMVKCFLFKPGHINAYRRLGWTAPNIEPTRDKYFKAAAVCINRNLKKELDLCNPQLVITMGAEVCRMIHGSDNGRYPAPSELFKEIVGQPLRADKTEHSADSRNKLFKGKNVFHMYHPGCLMRVDDPNSQDEIKQHFEEHLPTAKDFLAELGIVDPAAFKDPITTENLDALKQFVDSDHAKDMI